jgi:hypothetical protein
LARERGSGRRCIAEPDPHVWRGPARRSRPRCSAKVATRGRVWFPAGSPGVRRFRGRRSCREDRHRSGTCVRGGAYGGAPATGQGVLRKTADGLLLAVGRAAEVVLGAKDAEWAAGRRLDVGFVSC